MVRSGRADRCAAASTSSSRLYPRSVGSLCRRRNPSRQRAREQYGSTFMIEVTRIRWGATRSGLSTVRTYFRSSEPLRAHCHHATAHHHTYGMAHSGSQVGHIAANRVTDKHDWKATTSAVHSGSDPGRGIPAYCTERLTGWWRTLTGPDAGARRRPPPLMPRRAR